MTRQIVLNEIKGCFESNGISTDTQAKQIAEIAMDCTLEHILQYILSLNEELIISGFHSQAMTTNLIALKIKGILKNE